MYYILEFDGTERGDGDHDGATQTGSTIWVAANCFATLVVNYRDRISWSAEEGMEEVLPTQFATGPTTRSGVVQLDRRHGLLGVVLKGAGFLRLFNIFAPDVVNKRLPLESVFGAETSRLSQHIQEAESHEEKVEVMEAFLLRRVNEHALETNWTDRAVAIILENRGRIRMDTLSSRLAVSARHLRRRFKESTGLSPKLFARLKRFNYAKILLVQHPELDWFDVVHRTGFYDQAHFIKEFTQFAGTSPAEMVARLGGPRARILAES